MIGHHWIRFCPSHKCPFLARDRLARITNVFLLRATITNRRAACCTDASHVIQNIVIPCKWLTLNNHRGIRYQIACTDAAASLAAIDHITTPCIRLTLTLIAHREIIRPRLVFLLQIDITNAYIISNTDTSSLAFHRILTRHRLIRNIPHEIRPCAFLLLQVTATSTHNAAITNDATFHYTIHPLLKISLRLGKHPTHHIHNILPRLRFHQRTNFRRKLHLHFTRLVRYQLHGTATLLPKFIHRLID
mmetsp:Transcript_14081/g.24738  ORF Transcript_14081/g.24738 Transcript_14081/m.24738 type:complete len:247 (+) Transcript_14081:1252-1992(+)